MYIVLRLNCVFVMDYIVVAKFGSFEVFSDGVDGGIPRVVGMRSLNGFWECVFKAGCVQYSILNMLVSEHKDDGVLEMWVDMQFAMSNVLPDMDFCDGFLKLMCELKSRFAAGVIDDDEDGRVLAEERMKFEVSEESKMAGAELDM